MQTPFHFHWEIPTMRQSVSKFFLVLLALSFAGVATLFGQAVSGTATIAGLITDPAGAVVPAADITVRNVGTNVTRTLKSNDAGLYEVAALQPGDYDIKVAKAGFSTILRTGISVSVG